MPESIQLVEWPVSNQSILMPALEAKWANILVVRGEITKVLKTARRNKVIGHSLDANVNNYRLIGSC